MLTTLLFDLDGTLLPMDLDVFMRGYFRKLVPHIAHLVNVDTIADEIMDATHHMMENESPDTTNLEAFKRAFFDGRAVAESEIWPIFDAFYRERFAELRELTSPTPIAREICRTALAKGYQLVLATNPIFPAEAVEHRMRWAGIADLPFALVTTMEHMHYCKPNPKYYLEISARLNVRPDACMMFGNDVQEDGVASQVGMETFLVEDYLIDRGLGYLEFTRRGTLADALAFVEALPEVAAATC
ncbi:MAG: HAD family hydrolase [Alicyclobacillus sp.]|nr:HAD family hydrolase [Alicyclobacillus sp.]